jgi:hypothetical protein
MQGPNMGCIQTTKCHLQVYDRLLRRLQAPEGMAGADPLHPLVVEVLQEYAEFTPSKVRLVHAPDQHC